MLIFISGSINSGKTTTSKVLADKLNAVFINVDDLNDSISNFNLATDLDKSMDLAIKTINEHLSVGKKVVANYVLRQKDYERFAKEIKTNEQYIFTLAPRLAVAQSKRGNRTLTEWEISRIKHHYDTGIANPRFGYIVDNSDITIDETVTKILNIVCGKNTLPEVTTRVIEDLRKNGIKTVLYGSQGISLYIGSCQIFGDIDILVDESWLNEKWPELMQTMESIGFKLRNIKEREFINDKNLHVAFADIGILIRDNIVDNIEDSIVVMRQNNTDVATLKPEAFLKAYQYSSKDGYRIQKRGKKDKEKIRLIKQYLEL
jgi:cytidylate kinase